MAQTETNLKSNQNIPPIPSSASRLLLSNEPPSEYELKVIHSAIADATAKLSEIDNSSHNPDDMTAIQIKALQLFIETHRPLISLIRRLPTEVFAEIFSLCLPALHSEPSHYATILAITEVCKHWKNIAVSAPSLWSSLPTLEFQSGSLRFLDRKPDMLPISKLFLSRSKESLLDLRITAPSDYHRDLSQNPLLKLLLENSYRWRSVDIRNCTTKFFTYLTLVQDKVPALRTLHLNIISEGRSDSQASVLNVFEHAPLLRAVTCTGGGPLHALRLPWSQITQFSSSFKCNEQVLRVLRELPNLKACILKSVAPGAPSLPVIAPVTLDQLETLCLLDQKFNIEGEDRLVYILDHMTLPMLTTFEVHSSNGLVVNPLVSCIQRSSCSLQHLHLHTVSLKEGDLLRLLTKVPMLVALKVQYITDDDIRELANSFILPHLQDFAVYWPFRFTYPPMVDMVRTWFSSKTEDATETSCDVRFYLKFNEDRRIYDVRNKLLNFQALNTPGASQVNKWYRLLCVYSFSDTYLAREAMETLNDLLNEIDKFDPSGADYLSLEKLYLGLQIIARLVPPLEDEYNLWEHVIVLCKKIVPLMMETEKQHEWIMEDETVLVNRKRYIAPSTST